MGSKRKEVTLQDNISTQELWEEMLSSKGLTVVDVYQGWCGPCKPVVSLFQKMRIEVGLDRLHFALAEADCLDVLEKYRGRCEPTFLFYAIKDEALPEEDECFSHEKDDGEDEDVVSSEKSCTLAIIKPDAVVHGKTDEIIMKIQEAGFDILMSEERTTTEAEMRLFYQHRAGEEVFEKLVQHLCSGPSRLLILTRTEGTEDVVTAWRNLMGPCDPDTARREQPDSLRAQYGTEMPFNAVHGSRDAEDASRELALLFPSFKFSDQVLEEPLDHEEE
ncbi:thioredoxin domain-containing protein 6 isoform X3 [Saccopteryx leptura]|uniref:thioredoxin domain-containing protein 6 isoform X3 n=1 Tax=Saccopteryx leptura TaxID=249018 RepID=UPI00339C64EB